MFRRLIVLLALGSSTAAFAEHDAQPLSEHRPINSVTFHFPNIPFAVDTELSRQNYWGIGRTTDFETLDVVKPIAGERPEDTAHRAAGVLFTRFCNQVGYSSGTALRYVVEGNRIRSISYGVCYSPLK